MSKIQDFMWVMRVPDAKKKYITDDERLQKNFKNWDKYGKKLLKWSEMFTDCLEESKITQYEYRICEIDSDNKFEHEEHYICLIWRKTWINLNDFSEMCD